MWFAEIVLAGLVLLELIEGKIRGQFWRMWLTRQVNPRRYWTAIALQVAVILLIIYLRYS
jgi:hypothetical protein